MLAIGSTHTLTFPESRLINARVRYRRRRVVVDSVRDLVAEPLTVEDYLSRPFDGWSRWMVFAFDLRTGKPYTIPLGATYQHEAPEQLQIALYEPKARRPYAIVSREFEPTRRDRLTLSAVLLRQPQRTAELVESGLLLRVTTADQWEPFGELEQFSTPEPAAVELRGTYDDRAIATRESIPYGLSRSES